MYERWRSDSTITFQPPPDVLQKQPRHRKCRFPHFPLQIRVTAEYHPVSSARMVSFARFAPCASRSYRTRPAKSFTRNTCPVRVSVLPYTALNFRRKHDTAITNPVVREKQTALSSGIARPPRLLRTSTGSRSFLYCTSRGFPPRLNRSFYSTYRPNRNYF